ncbi:MAG: aldolase [Chloroflexota bacterium]|nr:MAG: aldolase [Chloroflexota bacterium]
MSEAQPVVAESLSALLDALRGCLHLAEGRLVIDGEQALRATGAATLAWTATFSQDPDAVEGARWIVWEASQLLGARSTSIEELYRARGRGEVSGFTVPAINLRTQVFDMAAAVFRAARARDVGPVICELARSEQGYTFQRPPEFITNVLAGALRAGWDRPVFVQGDHYQFNAAKYAQDPEQVTEDLRRLIREALACGYGNIDIDSSTLVDLSRPTVDDQQRSNYERAAELTALIREIEPDGLTVSVGGEIGEVGKENSTEPELLAYLSGYRAALDSRTRAGTRGVSKVSVQTGTSHGGLPLPDGSVAPVKVDFGVLERLGALARRQGLAGAVQHGASTLPDELFHHFPQAETAEIHLATGFQNALYEHPDFPSGLYGEIVAWCDVHCAAERQPDQDETQFIYKTRKKAFGPFKRTLWDLPERAGILADQEAKMGYLMEQLAVPGTAELVSRYVAAPERHREPPAAVVAARPAG